MFSDDTDSFDPDLIQIAYLVDLYVLRITEIYGGREEWKSAIGEPMAGFMLNQVDIDKFPPGDDILDLIFDNHNHAEAQIKRFMLWSGFPNPGLLYGRKHAAALWLAHNNPSLW